MASVRVPLIAGNWKMNTSKAEALALASQVCVEAESLPQIELLVCPPAIHLALLESVIKKHSRLKLGAQDIHWAESGAFTGELSGAMLKDYGVEYVLVGHSERRELFADTDQRVSKKFAAALNCGIKPILCVGETLEQREQAQTLQVITQQVEAVIKENGIDGLRQAVIAYEPVWAIGTGKTATPEQAQAVHAEIRQLLAGYSAEVAQQIRILYGGSMKPDNAKQLLAQPDIDGGLIGGASLNAESFLQIALATGH